MQLHSNISIIHWMHIPITMIVNYHEYPLESIDWYIFHRIGSHRIDISIISIIGYHKYSYYSMFKYHIPISIMNMEYGYSKNHSAFQRMTWGESHGKEHVSITIFWCSSFRQKNMFKAFQSHTKIILKAIYSMCLRRSIDPKMVVDANWITPEPYSLTGLSHPLEDKEIGNPVPSRLDNQYTMVDPNDNAYSRCIGSSLFRHAKLS